MLFKFPSHKDLHQMVQETTFSFIISLYMLQVASSNINSPPVIFIKKPIHSNKWQASISSFPQIVFKLKAQLNL